MNGRYQYEKAATSIMTWFHLAEDDLVGHAVTTTSGLAGTVKAIKLDEHHGLCFTLDEERIISGGQFPDVAGARTWWPVSIIKLHGPKGGQRA